MTIIDNPAIAHTALALDHDIAAAFRVGCTVAYTSDHPGFHALLHTGVERGAWMLLTPRETTQTGVAFFHALTLVTTLPGA